MSPSESTRTGVAAAIARVVLWPRRRFFDPRFRGLAEQADAQHVDLTTRLDDLTRRFEVLQNHAADKETLRQELGVMHDALTALAQADVDATREANELMGRSIGDLLAEASSTTAAVESLERGLQEANELMGRSTGDLLAEASRRTAEVESLERGLQVATDHPVQLQGSVEDLDAATADFLNYAAGHEGYAAQQGFWFNPPISLRHEKGRVRPADTNERIVELPYVYRALGRTTPGVSVLDVGAAESTLAFSLASLGYEVTALDIRGYPLEHPRLRTVTGDILDWKPEHRFDVVLCVSTLEHIGLEVYDADPAGDGNGADNRALDRIRELTNPGGMLILTVPFGAASADETQRSYDRPTLEALLAEWEIVDLTVVRQHDELTWDADGDEPGAEGTRKVALVTAIRPPH